FAASRGRASPVVRRRLRDLTDRRAALHRRDRERSMIPLLLIALALSAAALTYETSPKARAWTDAHLRAIAAHHTADAHLATSRSSPSPRAAVVHAQAAQAANQTAAKETIEAARAAQTEAQRSAAAQSAAAIGQRQEAITDAVIDG